MNPSTVTLLLSLTLALVVAIGWALCADYYRRKLKLCDEQRLLAEEQWALWAECYRAIDK